MASADSIRRSPSPPTLPPTAIGTHEAANQPNSQGVTPGRRPMTVKERRELEQHLQAVIHQLESEMEYISNDRAGMSDEEYIRRLQTTILELKNRRETLAKVIHWQVMSQAALSQAMSNLNASSGGNFGNAWVVFVILNVTY